MIFFDKRMTILFDLDGTLVHTENNDYMAATPIPGRVEFVNKLYDAGHIIIIDTARGAVSGTDWYQKTWDQLVEMGFKFDKLRVGQKLHYDLQVCDKTINSHSFFQLEHLCENPDERALKRFDEGKIK